MTTKPYQLIASGGKTRQSAALKAQNKIAQGNALGVEREESASPERA